MMMHVVVYSTAFQEFFVLSELKISSNLVEQFKLKSRKHIFDRAKICQKKKKKKKMNKFSQFQKFLTQKYRNVNELISKDSLMKMIA